MIRIVNLCLLARKVMHLCFEICFVKCSTKISLKNVSILSVDLWITGGLYRSVYLWICISRSMDLWISGSLVDL